MAVEGSFLELDLEEQLFAGVVHCSAEDCDALLREIEDVDIKNSRQRTLLHVAVRLRKVDWVERLLGLGADPSIQDGNGCTVVEAAEEMVGKVSDDAVRVEILKFVRLASKIGGVWKERTKRGGEGASGGFVELKKPECGVSTEIAPQGSPSKVNGLLREMKSFRGCVDQLRDEMRSKSNELSQQLLSSTLEISTVKEKVQSLKDDVTFLRESNGSVRSVVSALSGNVISIRCTLDELRKEVSSGKLETVAVAGRLSSLKEASNDIASKLTARDTLLETLEVSVTSLAEKVSEVIKSLEEESDSEEEEEEEAVGEVGTQVQAAPVALDSEEASRLRCIETLMRKTWLFDGNEEDAIRIRGLYARIYDEGPMTSSILTFLQSQELFHVTIECDSADIYGSKESLEEDRQSVQQSPMCTAVAHYKERQVHMKGKVKDSTTEVSVIGFFTRALTQMYIYLAFKNGGRPYHIGDRKEENMYETVMSDVVEKKVTQWLNWYVHDAVMNRDRNSKEINLISAVPAIIAQDGLNNAFTILRDQVPSLLDYYVDHVYVRLHRTVC